MVITTSGDVGIGTTSPTSPLTVKSNSTSASDSGITIQANANTNPLIKLAEKAGGKARFHMYNAGVEKIAFYTDGTDNHISEGNVGIGTSNPTEKLTISSDNPIVRIHDSSSTTRYAAVNFATAGGSWFLSSGDNATSGTSSNLFITRGTDGTSNRFIFHRDSYYFGVYDNTNTIKTVIRANGVSYFNGGNVGIGTTSPGEKLSVGPGDNVSAEIGKSLIGNIGISGYAGFKHISLGTNNYALLQSSSGQTFLNASSTESIRFRINNADKMTLTNAGNVGIGTTGPSFKLDVIGDGIRNIRSTAGWAGWFQNNASSSGVIITAGVDSGDAPLLVRKQDTTEIFSVRGNGTSYFQNGNVGIGTTSPSAKLHAEGDGSIIRLQNNNSDANGTFIDFRDSTGTRTGYVGTTGTSDDMFLYTQGAKPIRFYTNATERMRIDSSGNVGIGTVSPAGKLEVNGGTGVATSGGTLIVRQDGDTLSDGIALTSSNAISHRMFKNASGTFLMGPSTDADAFALDLNGNVGIGTTSPARLFHVKQSSSSMVASFESASGANSFICFSNTASTADQVRIGSTSGNLILSTNYSERLRINSSGNVGIGTTNPGRQLELRGQGIIRLNGISGEHPGIDFQTSDTNDMQIRYRAGTDKLGFFSYGTSTDVMTIQKSNGYVGIGTTSPARNLHIYDSSGGATLKIESNTANAYDSSKIELIGGNLSTGEIIFGDPIDSDVGKIIYRHDGNSLAFNVSASEKMRIDSSGNVGIGTTSPDSKLQVNTSSTSDVAINANGRLKIIGDGVMKWGSSAGHGELSWNSGYALYRGQSGNGIKLQVNGASTVMTLNTSGNVGIGTASPATKLHIADVTTPTIRIEDTTNNRHLQLFHDNNNSYIRSSTGSQLRFQTNGGNDRVVITTSGQLQFNNYGSGTFTGTATKNLAVDSSGNVIETDGSILDGSGTTNYVSKWSDANTLTDSQIFDNGTNVGIGTTSPGEKFAVKGDASYIEITHPTSTSFSGIKFSEGGTPQGTIQNIGSTFATVSRRSNFEVFHNTGGNLTLQHSGGNVGIGTSSPSAKLEVNGEAIFNTNTGTTPFYVTRQGTTGEALSIKVTDQNVRFESIQDEPSDGFGGFDFRMDSGTNEPDFIIRKGSDPALFLVNGGGNVGIGTTSPGEKLEVNGTIKTSTGLIKGANSSAYINLDGTVGSRLRYGNQHVTANATNLVFSTNSNVRMVVTNAGDVGIGTTTPASKLDINGDLTSRGDIIIDNSTGDPFLKLKTSAQEYVLRIDQSDGEKFQIRDVTNGATRVTLNTSGNIGIGKTSPSYRLDIEGPDLIRAYNPSGSASVQIKAAASAISSVDFADAGGDNNVGQIVYRHADDSMAFDTNDTEKMRITSGGNVGIGTTSPSAKLHAEGDGSIIRLQNNNSDANGTFIDFRDSTGTRTGYVGTTGTSDDMFLYTQGAKPIRFYTNATERMQIDSGGDMTISGGRIFLKESDLGNTALTLTRDADEGYLQIFSSGTQTVQIRGNGDSYINTGSNFGIGTSSPSQRLTVDGNIQATGTRHVAALYDANHYMRIEGNSSGGVLKGTDGGVVTTLVRTYGDSYFNGGNVGIGTTSPGQKLHVAGHIRVDNSTNIIYSNRFRAINNADVELRANNGYDLILNGSSGDNVGIGTASPSEKLTISSDNPIVRIHDSSSTTRYAAVNFATAGGSWFLSSGDNATSGTSSNLFITRGTDGTSNRFIFHRDSYYFGVYDNTNTIKTVIRANGNSYFNGGNVGIGTTSPTSPLTVKSNSTSAADSGITIQANANTNPLIKLAEKAGGKARLHMYNAGVEKIAFYTDGTSNHISEGNVGIGTSSPSTKLDVNGSASFNNAAIIDGLDTGNPTPAGEQTRISGYGIIGNRGSYYITNASSTGTIYWGIGGTHNANTKMTLRNTGDLGIGTTSPGAKLDVSGNIRLGQYNLLEWGGSASNRLAIQNGLSGATFTLQGSGNIELNPTSGGITFKASGSTAAVLNSSGNFGINETSPSARLHVDHSSQSTAAFKVQGQGDSWFEITPNSSTVFELGDIEQIGDGAKIKGTYSDILILDGNCGIGTSSPSFKLQLGTDSAAKPSSSAWTIVSDKRVKTNIRPYTTGLQELLQIEPKLFDYNGKAGFDTNDKNNIGVIAQEVKDIIPETVKKYNAKLNEEDEENTELYNFDSHALTFALINSVKELNNKIKNLEKKIQTLEDK